MRLNSTVEFSSVQSYSVARSKTAVFVYSRPKPTDWIVLGPCSLLATTVEFSSVLRPIPTRPICRRLTPIVGQQEPADSSGFRILNMFNMDSRPTITEPVVESDDSIPESADSAENPLKIGLWVRAFIV